jgi:hypothetical protein
MLGNLSEDLAAITSISGPITTEMTERVFEELQQKNAPAKSSDAYWRQQ